MIGLREIEAADFTSPAENYPFFRISRMEVAKLPLQTAPTAQIGELENSAEWERVPGIIRRFQLKRTKIYELINLQLIKSANVHRRGNIRGIRLVSVASVRSYLEGLANEQGTLKHS